MDNVYGYGTLVPSTVKIRKGTALPSNKWLYLREAPARFTVLRSSAFTLRMMTLGLLADAECNPPPCQVRVNSGREQVSRVTSAFGG